MIELEKAAQDILSELPQDHPDRKMLEGYLAVFVSHNAMVDGKAQITVTNELVSTPEQSQDKLELEWQKQAENLASLFAGELGKTKEEYIASLPEFEAQPENFKGRFDIPLIVETRVPLKRMLELAGINVYFGTTQIKDWEKGKFETPIEPYVVWMQDGAKNLNKYPKTVRDKLAKDERGASVYDGITLFLKDPNILNKHYMGLPGSQVGSGYCPVLRLWRGGPGLSCVWVDVRNPRSGSVSCGRIIG